MTTEEPKLGAEIERLEERLRGLRDHAQVQARLAAMDAEDAWTRLQGQVDRTVKELEDARGALQASSEEARVRGRVALLRARERAEAVGERFVELGTAAGASARQQIDLAGLRAHLARMEAEDYLGEKRSELEALARATTRDARQLLADGFRSITAKVERLIAP